jgi:hypothetical protein
MSDEISMADFLRFSNQHFCLQAQVQEIQDTRKAPQIPTPVIVMGVVAGGALGVESFRQLDRLLRQPSARRLLGSPRARVASDSTVARVMGTLEERSVCTVLQAITAGVRGRGYGKLWLPDRGPTRVGVIDGSGFGPLVASVFAQVGAIQLPEDLEAWEKRGKELPASYRLLRRLAARRGPGFVDLLVGDGLYMTHDFFRLCREELGCHGVVKTDEETLTLRQDADGLFDAPPPRREGVEYVEGVDAERAVAYRIWAASGFRWEGLAYPLRIARVWEEHLKGPYRGQTARFYVITTEERLSPQDLQAVGHNRWLLENNGFKGMNEQCHTKHAFIRDPVAMKRLLVLLFLAFVLVQAYRLTVEAMKGALGLAAWEPIAFRFLRQLFWLSLALVEPAGGG